MANKTFSTVQLFSIIDGRLSTDIGDVYKMLNHICDDELMTHHLPTAMRYLDQKNPKWLQTERQRLIGLKSRAGTDEFEPLIKWIKENENTWVDVPQLKDEVDTSDFGEYMADNSLLHKIGSARR